MKRSLQNVFTVKNFELFCLIFFFIFAIAGCEEGGCVSPFFTKSPVNTDDLTHIIPLGYLYPPSHALPIDHIGFGIRRLNEDSIASVNVYSPGDITITEVSYGQVITISTSELTEYYIVTFVPSSCSENQVKVELAEMVTLTQELLDQVGTIDDSCETHKSEKIESSFCKKEVNIELSAGALLGVSGYAFIYCTLYDFRTVQNVYSNKSRYKNSLLPYVACPVDYFDSETKSDLEQLFGDSSPSIAEPVCGTVGQDKENTAQGNWFPIDYAIDECCNPEQGMALAHYALDNSLPVFSVGLSIPSISGGTYYFKPEETGVINRDFDDISPDGNIYCFECLSATPEGPCILSTILLVQMLDKSTLRIEKQNAESCGNNLSFTSHTDFIR